MSKQNEDSGDWGKFNFREPEGFGIKDTRLPRHPSQTGPEYAAVRHKAFISGIDAFKLMTLPMTGKKDCQVVRYLYRNPDAKMNEIRDLTEDGILTVDAMRKTIYRINVLFRKNQIPLKIEKDLADNGHERVWLEIIT